MASKTSSGSYIELLSKDNYDTWRMQVEALLEKHDLWDYVNGSIKMPTAETQEKVAWLKQDKKAKADLILSIQPSELKQIRGCNTSNEVWIKLESIYASKGPARKATLLKQLMLHRLEDGKDVKEHMAIFFDAVDKLESMNVQINGDLLAIMLLYSLPSSYENFRCAIETRDDLPTAEVLKVKIIEESEARKQSSGNVVSAMVARNQKFKRSTPKSKIIDSSKTYKIKCYKCFALGHKVTECPKNRQVANNVDQSYAASYSIGPSVNVACGVQKGSRRPWLLDSGCTTHLCGEKDLFEDFESFSKVKLNLASQASAEVIGKGVVKLQVSDQIFQFKNTLFVPDLRSNLVSVAKITDKGHEVIFCKNSAYIRDECGNKFDIAVRRGDLYVLRENPECAEAIVESKGQSSVKVWHERLGHLNGRALLKLSRDKVIPDVLNAKDIEQLKSCEMCIKGKMTALPFAKNRPPCNEVLKIIHSDLVGPFRTRTLGGAKYFVTFIDDSTRWVEVYFLKEKSGVFEAFKLYKQFAENQRDKKVKCLQSDNGGEYFSNAFSKYLDDNGIERRVTVPHTPQQNGVAERFNRTVMDMARCLLLQSGLSSGFWSEAVATACYVRNRCPTSSLKGDIPYEKWTGNKLTLNDVKIFGSKIFILDKTPGKDKLSKRSLEGIFVGYPRERKGYRAWVPSTKRIIEARDVKFLENQAHGTDTSNMVGLSNLLEEEGVKQFNRTHVYFPVSNSENSPEPSLNLPNTYVGPVERLGETPEHVEPAEILEEEAEPPINLPETKSEPSGRKTRAAMKRNSGRPRLLRTGKKGRPKKIYQSVAIDEAGSDSEHVSEVFAGVAEIDIGDALESEDCDEWKHAMMSEVASLLKHDTWDIIKSVGNKHVIGCRWVLSNKHSPEGEIVRRKARLVAKGFSQKYGINYHETFAPVARLETLRLVLALAVQLNFSVHQFDVMTAYLNGVLDEEVIMRVPKHLPEMLELVVSTYGKNSNIGVRAQSMLGKIQNGGSSCKLKRALYGLKQAGRQWYSKLSNELLRLGLNPTKNEPCLFHGKVDEKLVLVLVYVDDLLVASSDQTCINMIKLSLLKCFEIKDLGMAKYCLGLEIRQNKDCIELSQKGYILGLLDRYGMLDCNPVATPSEVNLQFEDVTESEENCDFPYRELIGALMYLSVATRPDIANTISRLAQFTNKPRKCHWLAAKRVLRYLAGSANIGLKYLKDSNSVIGYVDADWGNCHVDRRSYTGYAYILSGAAIAWKSQKQRTVALSSTEAEYVSLAEAAKEALYLKSLLGELELNIFKDIVLYGDNMGAQYLANNPVFHARTKHIDIKHHFVRDSVRDKIFLLKHVPTENMLADVLTKSLVKIKHNNCLFGLGLHPVK